jgi:hypothetical protein
MKYVCNSNGDWWAIEDTVTLWVLDMDDLSPEDLADVEKWGIGDDKFEYMIQDYGTEMEFETK